MLTIQLALLAGLVSCGPSDGLRLPPGELVTLINTRINNGSFEDWEGASEPLAEPRRDRILAEQDRKLTIPGWTVRSDNWAGFEKKESSSHLRGRFHGRRNTYSELVSDAYAAGAGFTEGTEINLAFDLLILCNQGLRDSLQANQLDRKDLVELVVYLIFDGSDEAPAGPGAVAAGPEAAAADSDAAAGSQDRNFVLLKTIHVPDGHAGDGEQLHIRGLQHALTATQAKAANANGVRLFFLTHKNECIFYGIDKVELTARTPSD